MYMYMAHIKPWVTFDLLNTAHPQPVVRVLGKERGQKVTTAAGKSAGYRGLSFQNTSVEKCTDRCVRYKHMLQTHTDTVHYNLQGREVLTKRFCGFIKVHVHLEWIRKQHMASLA